MPIDGLLSSRDFPPAYPVEGREAIANLLSGKKRCGIYVLHFTDGRYYVGQSVDVTRRYVQHRRKEVRRAIRRLNLRLMRKGPSPYRTSHCLDLADHLVGVSV